MHFGNVKSAIAIFCEADASMLDNVMTHVPCDYYQDGKQWNEKQQLRDTRFVLNKQSYLSICHT